MDAITVILTVINACRVAVMFHIYDSLYASQSYKTF